MERFSRESPFLPQYDGIPIPLEDLETCADFANLSFSYGKVGVFAHLVVSS